MLFGRQLDEACGGSGCWQEGRRGACGRAKRAAQVFGTEAVGIAAAISFEQTMNLQFAKGVAELILFGSPSADGGTPHARELPSGGYSATREAVKWTPLLVINS